MFDQLPYTGSGPGSGYNPLYPFAFGLSYTTFKVSGLSATGSVSRNGTVTARFTVATWATGRAPTSCRCTSTSPSARCWSRISGSRASPA